MVARVHMVASKFIRRVSAVIRQVTQLTPVHTVSVGALKLRVRVARFASRGAQSHVIFIGAIAAVVDAVAYLVPGKVLIFQLIP